MKKLIGIELYKRKKDPFLWGSFFFLLLLNVYTAFQDRYEVYYHMDSRIEYNFGIQLNGSAFVILAIAVTGYGAALDLQSGTVRNILLAGISRRSYYFAGLACQLLMNAALFAAPTFVFAGIRFWTGMGRGNVNHSLSFGEFLIILLVMLLQLLAHCAVVNLLCFLFRNQAVSMLVGFGVYFLEMMAAAVADLNHLEVLTGFTDWLPAVVVGRCNNIIVETLPGLGGIWKYGGTAAGIIAVCSAAGYLSFKGREQF